MPKFWDINPPPKNKNLFIPGLKTSSRPRRIILISSLLFLIIFSGFFAFNLLTFKNKAKQSLFSIKDNFQVAAQSLSGFKLDTAQSSLQSVNKDIQSLKGKSDLLGLTLIDEVKIAFINLSLLGQKALGFGEDLADLSSNGFQWLVGGQGEKLISKLESLRNNMDQLVLISSALQDQALKKNLGINNEGLEVGEDLKKNLDFLDALIGWLKPADEQHFLVLFQNASELRPAGGFIGSYADLTLKGGSLINVDVRDIYDPDGQLDLKIIPPKPLQAVTLRWGARDANWFFDFSLSARKVIEFLEKSKIYSEKNIEFSGAIAVNMESIRDILAATGPIKLGEYDLEINSGNVLEEIQREVEEGQDKKIGEPKKILKVLAPMLFEKIGNLDEDGKVILAGKLGDRFVNKDIMIYFKDLAIESYLKNLGVAGEVMDLPEDFNGSYLAVVNANIGGHKTDEFINQKIQLDIDISSNGKAVHNLAIQREHFGQNEKEWWYKASNKDYLQIFVPSGSEIIAVSGAEQRDISKRDYRQLGYKADADVVALESSYQKIAKFGIDQLGLLGKTIFGSWLITDPGKEKSFQLSYASGRPAAVSNGAVYTFIFEKQSGSKTSLAISLTAPSGYVWKENGRPVFDYSIENPPARLILKTTLSQLAN